MKAVFVKTEASQLGSDVLFPPDEESKELLRAFSGSVMVDIKKCRNPGNHRRYFAFINKAFDNQDHFPNVNGFRKWLQMRAGLYYTVEAPNGHIMFIPESICWEDMDEIEFKKAFNDVVQVYIDWNGSNLDENALNEIVRF